MRPRPRTPPASKKIVWTGPQSPFCASEIPFPFPFELLPFRPRMVRFRCNSFVETTCIPKRKLQEHIRRIPPWRGVPDIGLIIHHAVIPCISWRGSITDRHGVIRHTWISIYIVWVSPWSVWTSAEKAYKKQELIARNKFIPFIVYRRQRGVRCCGSNNYTARRCQPSKDGSVSRRRPLNLTTVILTFELPKVCFCLLYIYIYIYI